MRVTFELSDRDLSYFKQIIAPASDNVRGRDEQKIRARAAKLLARLNDAEVSDFVRDRLLKLETMIRILEDSEWKLSGADRARVVDALAYFVKPDDLVPDRVPSLGYLDDAIMIELVARELHHDLEAYEDFCEFRTGDKRRRGTNEDSPRRGGWLKARREQLHARMRRRRARRHAARASSSGGSPIGLR